jgi:16S rRNA (uracil1498-N3)-methyltransferase
MSRPVFLTASLADARPGETVLLAGPEGRHAAAVRRLGPGEPVDLVDGTGRRASGRVAVVLGHDSLTVDVVEVVDEPAPDPRLVVVQALPKGERSDLAVELLTEVGVDVIVPWAAERCVAMWRAEKAERGVQRWRATAREAAKQSRRARLPVVAALATTREVAARVGQAAAALVLDEQSGVPLVDVVPPPAGDVVVVVGPEGGLSDAERSLLVDAGAELVRLGPTVLRTSTAGAVAVSLLSARTGRWS